MNHRTNNLDGLRLLGALLVILGHGYVLTGRLDDDPQAFGYVVQTLGVVIFFAISGYLIAASWDSKRDPVSYFTARSLRIFPALIAVVVLTALVLGPLATSEPVGDYFRSRLVWEYFRNIGLYVSHLLPGVTDSLPFPLSINGALWTLAMEFTCYLLVPLVVIRRWNGRLALLLTTLFALVLLANQPPSEWPIVWGMKTPAFAQLAEIFVAGSIIRACVERFGRAFMRWDVAVVLAAAHVVVIGMYPSLIHWVGWITMPYVVLTIGLARMPVLSDASRYGDFSYGMYLWAFPVQQLVVLWAGPTRILVDVPVVAGITLMLAFASWHLVEKPCLTLKERLVRRRAAGPTATSAVPTPQPR